MDNEVECGFRKWSIGIDDDARVVINYNYHPIEGVLYLSDLSEDQAMALSKLFKKFAKGKV